MTPSASVTIRPEAIADHTGAAFLEAMTEHGWSPEDIEATARAFHVLETEISTWRTEQNTKYDQDRLRLETATAVLAAGGERAILNRGRVLTPAILEANAEQLLQFIEFYERECDELYRQMTTLAADLDNPAESFEYLTARHKFDRLAGFLWESRTQSGVWAVHHPEMRDAS